MLQAGDLLSEVRALPGATDTLFDVIAAAVALLAPGPRVAILGFAGGGMMAPLRALGYQGEVDAVDHDRAGHRLFTRYMARWAGPVRFHHAEAATWLARPGRIYDGIVEDLSIAGPTGATKPAASLDPLPALLRRRLAPRGVAVVNLLPVPGVAISRLAQSVSSAFPEARQVFFRDYENRLLLLGRSLPPAREIGAMLRGELRRIRSALAGAFRVRVQASKINP